MKIIDYIVISGNDPADITRAVCTKLRTGWQPFGELKTVKIPDCEEPDFYQAMVVYGTEEAFNTMQIHPKKVEVK